MGFVKRRDSGNWVARYRDPHGKACKKTFRLKAEAEAFLVTVEASKLSGNYLPENKVTLAEWWARYESEVPRRATTAACDRVVMGHWWLPALGRRALRSLTPADVRRVVSAMADRPLSPVTVRTHLGVFSAVMTRAIEAELIARSPVRGIRLPDTHRRQPRFLTGDELARLAEEMPVEYRPMVYLAGVLGLRWSEVAGLRVGRVDFLRRSISIVETLAEVEGQLMFAPPKSKASVRTVTAPAELLEVLAADRRDADGRGPTTSCSPRRKVARCASLLSASVCGGQPSAGRASTGSRSMACGIRASGSWSPSARTRSSSNDGSAMPRCRRPWTFTGPSCPRSTRPLRPVWDACSDRTAAANYKHRAPNRRPKPVPTSTTPKRRSL